MLACSQTHLVKIKPSMNIMFSCGLNMYATTSLAKMLYPPIKNSCFRAYLALQRYLNKYPATILQRLCKMVLFSFGNFLTLLVHYLHFCLFRISNEICVEFCLCHYIRIYQTRVAPTALLHEVHVGCCYSAQFARYSCTNRAELKL
uniref:Uncharacterized protein n=1 Tax=Rhipicephalus appendiculatus TaxID=34631 RepID=A0A131YBS4_RHIAP